MGFGEFGPLDVIIHHRDPQKAHPCVNPRFLSYQLQKSVEGSGELTVSVTDTHTHTHTHLHTHAGEFIFCPCIALDGQ